MSCRRSVWARPIDCFDQEFESFCCPVELEECFEEVRPPTGDVADDRAGDVARVGRVVVGLDAISATAVGARLIRPRGVDRLVMSTPSEGVVVVSPGFRFTYAGRRSCGWR